MLTDEFLGAARVLVIGVGAPGHISQVAPVSRPVYSPARAISKAIVSRSAARVVPKRSIAARNKAIVQLLSRRRVAGAVAHVDIWAAHCWSTEFTLMVRKAGSLGAGMKL